MGTTGDKLKGKLKKAEGEVTGDEVREGQGWVEEKTADVKEGIENVGKKIEDKVAEKSDSTRQRDR